MDVLLLTIILFCLVDTIFCGSYCYDDGRTFYCKYDCCGSYGDEYCCGVYSWIVAVAVVGGIILISIAVFVFVCVKKKKMKQGRVIGSSGQNQVHTTVIHAPPPGPQMHPPNYQQHAPGYMPQQQGVYPPPPPMNYGADPAYPPPGH